MEYEYNDEGSEFWQNFENKIKSRRNISDQFNFIHKDLLHKQINEPEIAKLEERIKELRFENLNEQQVLSTEIKKQTKSEIIKLVKQLEAEFEIEIRHARNEFNKMIDELIDQNQSISTISKYLSEREVFITQNKIFKHFVGIVEIPKTVEKSNTESLEREKFYTKLALEGLRDGIKKYANDTGTTTERILELQKLLVLTKENNEKEIKDFQTEGNRKIAEGKHQNMMFRKELEEFKKEKMKELNAAEEKCRNNEEMINMLRYELKHAKIVLQSSSNNLRVHERLQDYINEYSGGPTKARTKKKVLVKSRVFQHVPVIDFGDSYDNLTQELTPSTTKIKFFDRRSSTGDKSKRTIRSSQYF